jgi:signal transduction histidine kinase
MKFRVPIAIQVGVVAALFVAALAVLWTTGAEVVGRERRRSEAKAMLDRAGKDLVASGREIIAQEGDFLNFHGEESRVALDRKLAAAAAKSLGRYSGIEGGFWVVSLESFAGAVLVMDNSQGHDVDNTGAKDGSWTGARGGSSLPPLEAELIDIQVDAAMRKKSVLFSVEELDDVRPVTVAIRTAPVVIDNRVAGATWVMTRLVDPLFVDRSLRGYQFAAGLALGGIALAFALTAGLARTVRRQATERDRLQAELRRSERLAAMGKLLAGVAHEVRNPLAGIRSTAQLWQRGIMGIDGESLGGMVHEVDRLEDIVSRLLHFSRADAQDLAPGDLNAVLAEAARLASVTGKDHGVRVEVDLDPQLPAAAMARPALLQVFRNLTANAIQAMAPGGTLCLASRKDPSGHAILAIVTDTGPGLEPETLKHLFEPFFTTKAEGAGLGLAIAREIALAHRGDLRAANRGDGTGAVFTLSLPLASATRNGEHP